MARIQFSKTPRVLSTIALLVVSGCGASSSVPHAARAPTPTRTAAALETGKPTGATRTATEPEAPAAAPLEQTAVRPTQTVELTVEGEVQDVDPQNPMLPCNMQVSRQGSSMIIDFHAGRSAVSRIRQQTRDLEYYLNNNRADARATRSPDGRPDPISFPIRQILGARPIASVEDLPDGARLTLSPDDQAHPWRLVAEVLWHAGDLLPGLPLAGKTCPELPPELQTAAIGVGAP